MIGKILIQVKQIQKSMKTNTMTENVIWNFPIAELKQSLQIKALGYQYFSNPTVKVLAKAESDHDGGDEIEYLR